MSDDITPLQEVASAQRTMILNPADDVAVALETLTAGERLTLGATDVTLRDTIPNGHKIALRAIAAGQAVRKFGQVIGYATQPIVPGEHVHVQNLDMGTLHANDAAGCEFRPTVPAPSRHFLGIRRPDGRIGTRNYIGVLSSVNCSATVCRMIADAMRAEAGAFDGIDGVVAITHQSGCGMDRDGEGFALLSRVMTGYANHPNFAGILVVGLGCEVNQVAPFLQNLSARAPGLLASMTIQEAGGTRAAVAAGVDAVRAMLPIAAAIVRETVSLEHLVVGLQCGGSDAYSGITANPVLGAAVDRLVAQGGTAILSETPEIYGAEHLLTARAANGEVAERLMAQIRWWENYTAQHGGNMNNNPSPGNKAGGITTILEKSLGAVAKAGTTGLMNVHGYADAVMRPGLCFMDSPGYDPVSATGQVAGGANLICFTTGRGSTYGCKPTPSLKIATNTKMFRRMESDMDFDAGRLLSGTGIDELAEDLLDLMIDTASGLRSRSEENGLGDNEFVPWQLGTVM